MNRDPGALADVWTQLVLAEVVRAQRPDRYAETHARSAVTPLVDDAERRYGVRHVVAALGRPCTWLDVVRPFLAADRVPGAAAVALSVRPDVDALVCATTTAAAADLTGWVGAQGAAGARVVTGEAVTQVRGWLAEGRALVHIDPLDPWAAVPHSTSSVELATDAARAGHTVVFAYGYDRPDDRDWAVPDLGVPGAWAGDLLVTTAAGTVEEDGDLDDATSPGTGCGVLVTGVDRPLARRLETLGRALVDAYAGAPLPDGRPGGLDLLVDTR